MQRLASTSTFFKAIPQTWYELQVMKPVPFVNAETKQQSKQWMHLHSPNKPKFKQSLPARKLMVTVFWNRKEVLMVEFMQQRTTMSEVYRVQNTRRTAYSYSEHVWNADIQHSAP
jgi:hypothetical protein